MKFLLVLPCLALAGTTLASPFNLLSNGSFEEGDFGLGLTQVPGWQVLYHNVDINGLSFDQGLMAAAPGQGLKYCELVGTPPGDVGGPGASAISQPVATTPGSWYAVTGWVTRHPGLGENAAAMTVAVEGSLLEKIVASAPAGSWRRFRTMFRADGPSSLVTFADATGLYDSGGANVDGLSVSPFVILKSAGPVGHKVLIGEAPAGASFRLVAADGSESELRSFPVTANAAGRWTLPVGLPAGTSRVLLYTAGSSDPEDFVNVGA